MKKFTVFFCSAAMALCLTGCGGKDTESAVTIDIDALAEALLETVTSDTLSETASDLLPSIYFYESDSVESATAYMSSGATACEIAVIQSKDADYTDDVEAFLKTRVDNQSSLYASYNAGEVEKLDDAIIESSGVYTVLCVCDDVDGAKDVLKEYGF